MHVTWPSWKFEILQSDWTAIFLQQNKSGSMAGTRPFVFCEGQVTPNYSQCSVWVRYVICMSMCRSTTYNKLFKMLCIPVQCHECIATVLHEVTCTRAVDPINLGYSGPTPCDPLRLSSTATFATHLHFHERFTRFFPALLICCSWPAPVSAEEVGSW